MSSPWRPELWHEVPGFGFTDITYHHANDVPAVRIAFNRPEVRNAFRPQTVDELYTALDHARQSADVGCVLLTGNGPSEKDGGWAFCSAATSASGAVRATSTPRVRPPTPWTTGGCGPRVAGCTFWRCSG